MVVISASLTGRPTIITIQANASANKKLNSGPAKATIILSSAEILGSFARSRSMIAAVEKVMAAAKANGKFSGLGGDRDIERQTRFIRNGVQFVTTQSDIAFLMAEASRRTHTLRGAIAK